MTTQILVSGEECPEGILYPTDDSIPHADLRAKALSSASASWRVIGDRQVTLAHKWTNRALHAIRTRARGYGKRRKFWKSTTECGQIAYEGQGWNWWAGPLRDTTCLSCRKIVRERYEDHLEYDAAGLGDDLLDEYNDLVLSQQQAQEWWQVQAEWHRPDPVIPNWVGEGVLA